MRQSLNVFFLLVTLSITSKTCFGQKNNHFLPGYVITNEHDSISGLILSVDHKSGTRRCVYKKSTESSETIYQAGEIEAYGIGSEKYFYSSSVVDADENEMAVFLECIVKGKASLFFLNDRLFINTQQKGVEELQLVKDQINKGGQIFRVDRPLYKSTLQSSLDDCPEISEKIMALAFTRKGIIKLMVDYNVCVNEDVLVYKKASDEKVIVSFGFSMGTLYTSMDYDGSFRQDFPTNVIPSTSLTFTPSVFAEFSQPGFSNRISVRTGVSYKQMSNEMHDEARLVNNNRINDLLIETSCLEVPLLVKFDVLKRSKALYLLGGIGTNIVVKSHDEQVTSSGTGIIVKEYYDRISYNNVYIGYNIGLGYSTTGRHKIFFEAQYSHNPLVLQAKAVYPKITYNTLRFQVGIHF